MAQTISVETAHDLLKKGEALLIDVREAEEFAQEHIPQAISLPLSKLTGSIQDCVPQGKKLIFQCQKGMRGDMACVSVSGIDAFKGAEILNLEGGIESWKKANYPIISSDGANKTLPIIRQVQIVVGMILFLLSVSLFLTQNLNIAYGILVIGMALSFAGITGWCGLAKFLSYCPWNRA